MSTYPVLDNKPIDQWRVTELKEELKRRKLPVRGLKDDLIRRLDEALREESEAAKESNEYSNDNETPAIDEVETDDAINFADETGKKNQESEKMSGTVADSDNKDEEMGDVRVDSDKNEIELGAFNKSQVKKDDDMVSLDKDNALRDSISVEEENKMSVETSVETEVRVSENVVNGTGLISEYSVNETGSITKNMVNETGLSGEDLKNETENKIEESKSELKIKDPESSDINIQVYEVSEVISESIYTNTTTITTTTTTTSTDNIVTVNEKKEQPKENIIADDVKLEFDVKQLPSENSIVDDGKLLVATDNDDIQEEERKKIEIDFGEGTGGNVGSVENMNIDQSFGENSMEEDGLDTKDNSVSKLSSDNIAEKGDGVNTSDLSAEAEKKSIDFESKNEIVVSDVKRKFNGGGHVSEVNNKVNIDTTKRQKRWNSEGKNPNISTNTTKAAALPMHKFSRFDAVVSEEPSKERIVPPSSKPSTTSLRIDRFLRPFTLKAVQEFLGKTGRVTSFWMDNIKTHCYVTYSSVKEAEETRNAVYNLQWPPNGGRLLVAEFVDPQEVKTRVDAPPPSPAAPTTTAPPLRPLPPPPPMADIFSSWITMQRQQLPPPPSLPPPPPPQLSLPPPPPLPESVEPPILTLDDLFKKTKTTPRIYYLPLTNEQVEHKKMAQAKTASTT